MSLLLLFKAAEEAAATLRNLVDSVSLLDQRASSLDKGARDVSLMVDARLSSLQKLIADTIRPLTDTVAALKEASRFLTDAILLTDRRLSELGKAIGDPTLMADARYTDLQKRVTDALKELTDVVTAVKEANRAFTESVALTDARTSALATVASEQAATVDARFFALSLFFTEVLRPLADVVTAVKEAARLFSEAVALTDTRASTLNKLGSESARMVDARFSVQEKFATDALRLTDAVTVLKEAAARLVNLLDALAVTDRRLSALGKAIGDSTLLVDARSLDLQKMIAQTLRPLTDAVSAVKEAARLFAEALFLTDTQRSDRRLYSLEQQALQDARLLEMAFVRADSAALVERRSLARELYALEGAQQLADARSSAVLLYILEAQQRLLSTVDTFTTALPPVQVFERLLTDRAALVDALIDVHWSQYRTYPGIISRKVVE